MPATSFELQAADAVHGNGHQALRAITLRATRGERIALIGPSGAGKTTLLRLLGTSLSAAGGSISLLGRDPRRLRGAELRRLRARIGHIHQAPPIPPRQRVVHAVLAGRLGQWPWWRALSSLAMPVDAAGAATALDRLELADQLYQRCDRLSGGQLQRVALARVLYQRPELILADEPVSAMDPALAELTATTLNDEARRRGATLVASLHAVDLALRHFPRVIGIRGGQLCFDCAAANVSDAMLTHLYASEGDWRHVAAAGELAAEELVGPRLALCR